MTQMKAGFLNPKYRELAQKTNLNGLLRAVFSPIHSVEECDSLIEKAESVWQELKAIQTVLIESFREDEITRASSFRLIRDSRSAATTPYLRWRNYADYSHGNKWFNSFLEQMPQEDPLLTPLCQVENMRVVLNMQIGLIHNLMSQLKNMRKLMAQGEKIISVKAV